MSMDSTLALFGGEPVVPSGYTMRSRWPRTANDGIEVMMDIIKSGQFTEMSGRERMHEFESTASLFFNVKYVLTTNSGTAALHCALAGLGINPGDEVIVPALAYIACPAAVIHQRGVPIFADVDPQSYNVTQETIEPHITKRTRAIMVVHLHGLPAELDGILALAERHNLAVIEDFSQSVGAKYKNRYVGTIGHVGAASLMAGKNLASAGEAGMLFTNDRLIRNKAATLKTFGEAVEKDGSYRILHETLGYNYRANILALAYAGVQLFNLENYNNLRRESAKKLDEVLSGIPGFTPPATQDNCHHVYHMYRFRFDPAEAGLSISVNQGREALKKIFFAEGLPLVEFQNHPLPGHALMQQKVGYGGNCPWACHSESAPQYRSEDFPGALDAIRHSLIVGYPAEATLVNDVVIDAYIRAFQKVAANMNELEKIGKEIEDLEPWDQEARLF